MAFKGAAVDPRLLDFVTWSMLRGVRLFQRVRVTPKGLMAIDRIPKYDFAAVIPTRACLSALNVVEHTSFPLRVSPSNFGNELKWWPDLCWGNFAFVALLTSCWITGNFKGLQSYLDILPFDPSMPIGKLADASQRSPEYRDAIAPVAALCRTTDEKFDLAMKHVYCLFRRHGIPLWTSATGGHPFYEACELAREGRGDIIGMVPVVDLTLHTARPNTAIGFPDKDMMNWLAQERGLRSDAANQYIVLQALRDIEEGEPLTADRNEFYGFDHETFNAWFGFPYDTPLTRETHLQRQQHIRQSHQHQQQAPTDGDSTSSSSSGAEEHGVTTPTAAAPSSSQTAAASPSEQQQSTSPSPSPPDEARDQGAASSNASSISSGTDPAENADDKAGDVEVDGERKADKVNRLVRQSASMDKKFKKQQTRPKSEEEKIEED